MKKTPSDTTSTHKTKVFKRPLVSPIGFEPQFSARSKKIHLSEEKETTNRPTRVKSPISLREEDCLSLAAIGKTSSEIAHLLNISEHTVNFHTKNAIKKLAANNKTHAVAKAITCGYITLKFGN